MRFLHKFGRLCVSCGFVCRGASSLVHYWYHPDSYDRCLPAEVAPEVIEPDKRIRGRHSLPQLLHVGKAVQGHASLCLEAMCMRFQGHPT